MIHSSAWNNITIDNQRGQKLAALYIPAYSSNNPGPLKVKQAPLIVVCHGFTGSKEGGGRALQMGENLSRSGYGVLLFDFTGCGKSEGRWEDITLSGQIDDLGAVVSWCRDRGHEQIILNGRSFGGSTALGHAARDSKVKAVCTWAAVAFPGALFKNYLPGSHEGPPGELVELTGGDETVSIKRRFFYDLEAHNLLKYAADIAPRSLIIIHGTNDQSVPFSDGEMLYAAAGQPKQLVLIDGADHRFTNHMDQVWHVFFSWLKDLSR